MIGSSEITHKETHQIKEKKHQILFPVRGIQDQRINQPISGGAYLLWIWKNCGLVLEVAATGGSGA